MSHNEDQHGRIFPKGTTIMAFVSWLQPTAVYLMPAQYEDIHAWYCKSSQLTMANGP